MNRQNEIDEEVFNQIFNEEVAYELICQVDADPDEDLVSRAIRSAGDNPWDAHIIYLMLKAERDSKERDVDF